VRKDLWNYDPSARWKKQHRKPIVYPPAIHRSSRPLRRQHFEPGEWRIGRAQAGTTFYDIVRSWKAGYLFLVTPEGWPSGLRQRMYVRYTGNRIGGSNPSPSATRDRGLMEGVVLILLAWLASGAPRYVPE
jgi:hypothetical protein